MRLVVWLAFAGVLYVLLAPVAQVLHHIAVVLP